MDQSNKLRRPPNFSRWILGLCSFCNVVLGPLIIYQGFNAYSYGLDIIVADKALIAMGFLVCLLAFVAIYGVIMERVKVLHFYFYSALICIIFLSVFAVGAYVMTDDMTDWIQNNWYKIRIQTGVSLQTFTAHVHSEVQSLAALAGTVDLFLMIGVICTGSMIKEKIKNSLLAVCNLELVILGFALIVISIYAEYHNSYTNLPVWTSWIFALMGVLLIIIGVFGYYISFKGGLTYLYVYTAAVVIGSLCVLVGGIGFLIMSGYVLDELESDWEDISAALRRDGYSAEQEEYGQNLKRNEKFSGLFGVVTFCYLLLGVVGGYFQIVKIKERMQAPHLDI